MAAKLGKTINRLRRAYNYSLGDLSEQSGVAKSIISQIEKNETNPTLGTLYKLARALNAPIEEILRGEDTPALIEKLGPAGTPLLVSEDGRAGFGSSAGSRPSSWCNGIISKPSRAACWNPNRIRPGRSRI